ncbi:Flavin-dependent monooxygenase, oxygenase subunit HsaA [Nocardiopsis dassonvillei]|uniref:3-hydroxy-9,10-secoandrosta-1,3,5(10)-triene-9, 17-dione monooxygenase oxygenase subunit n=1 Tax=Nocardiopsis dassonvillei TaxID=2014 RepID=UPI003F560B8E
MSTEVEGSPDLLLTRVEELAEETERAGEVPEETIRGLVGSGFFRLLQPVRYGGREEHPLAFFSAVRDLSSACGSTGWVASILGVHAWNVALFHETAQDEVWGTDPDALVCSSYAPMGRARPVPGGYRLSGRWHFSSGCSHASWALVGALVDHGPGRAPELNVLLVPVGDYRVERVWDSVGLAGTGSHDLAVDDVFVPEHRSLNSRLTTVCRVPGRLVNTGPLYRMPFGSFLPYAVSVPLLGMARRIYREHVEHTRERVRTAHRETGTGRGVKAAEDPTAQLRVAEAACDLDASWLQLERNLALMLGSGPGTDGGGRPIPMGVRTAVRRDQVTAARRAVRAADSLFGASGGRALAASGTLQRFWRDTRAGGLHALNDHDRVARLFGRSEFGLEVLDPML